MEMRAIYKTITTKQRFKTETFKIQTTQCDIKYIQFLQV